MQFLQFEDVHVIHAERRARMAFPFMTETALSVVSSCTSNYRMKIFDLDLEQSLKNFSFICMVGAICGNDIA